MTRGTFQTIVRALFGRPCALSTTLLARYPELAAVRWRVGGLPLRVGGWCLGRRTVAGITLGRTVFLADADALAPALLLHELAHVEQFARHRAFPLRYAWQSLLRGYPRNRYELEADAFAAGVLAERPPLRGASPVGPTPATCQVDVPRAASERPT
ncbi:MAG: hypothetical protein ACXWZ4_07260 [Gemmatirosa sp.]